jgi:hypothetical protein
MSAHLLVLRRFVWLLSAFWVLATVTFSRADTLVYSNDFEAPVGAEWSNPLVSTTPSGRGFLGEFVATPVTLSLDGLGTHASVRVEVELFIIQSWDGGLDRAGPDIWGMQLVGGPVLSRWSEVPRHVAWDWNKHLPRGRARSCCARRALPWRPPEPQVSSNFWRPT